MRQRNEQAGPFIAGELVVRGASAWSRQREGGGLTRCWCCAACGLCRAVGCRGTYTLGQLPPPSFLTDVVAVTGTAERLPSKFGLICASRATGELYCFGDAQRGVDRRNTTAMSNLRRLSTGSASVVCGIRADGEVVCGGAHEYGGRAVPDTVHGRAVDIAGTCAVLDDGSAECWGRYDFGQSQPRLLGDVPAAALTTGAYHSCAVLAESLTVHCWGDPEALPGFDARGLPTR